MLEFLKGLFSGDNGVVVQIISIVGAVNSLLSAVGHVLDVVKAKSASEFVQKIVGYIQAALDFLQGNKAHK